MHGAGRNHAEKVGIIAIMEAIDFLAGQGTQPARDVWLAFGHDEEFGGLEGAAAMAGILSDRDVQAALVLDEGGIITSGRLPGIDQPVALVGVAEKGYLSVELLVEGESGHSSDPSPVSSPDSAGFALLRRSIEQVSEEPLLVAPYLVVGATDARHYSGLSDQVLRFSGFALDDEEIAGFHGIDERIRTSELARAIRYYRRLLQDLERLD